MENKFKVGDLVTGNALSDDWYAWTNSKMKKGVITKLFEENPGLVRVKILDHEDELMIGGVHAVESKYFDFCYDPDSIKIFRNSKATVCEVKSEGKRLSKGVAKCCPEDEYNFIEGSKIALDRADANIRA